MGGETWNSQSEWTLSPLISCDVGPDASPLGASLSPLQGRRLALLCCS